MQTEQNTCLVTKPPNHLTWNMNEIKGLFSTIAIDLNLLLSFQAVPETRLTQFQVSSSCWETSPAWASGCIPHLQPTSGNGSCQCGSTPGNPVPLRIGEKAVKPRGHPPTKELRNASRRAEPASHSLRRLESALAWRYMKYVYLGAALPAPQG